MENYSYLPNHFIHPRRIRGDYRRPEGYSTPGVEEETKEV
jgi:hypothetical protein